MAWINIIGEDSAAGELAELFAAETDPSSGRVDNVLKIHSLHPEGLRSHSVLYRSCMKGTRTLPRVEREMIAVVVSVINECHY